MNLRARRFLSWIFIITFFLIAPVIILSTAGYRYNFTKHRLERTGVLVVESRPSGASVSLDGKLQKQETPAHLQRVTPDTYAVRVEKAGYFPWTKTVTVGSRETAFLNQISLFRQDGPALLKAVGPTAVSAFTSDVRYGAAVASASSGSELVIVDTRNGATYLPYRSSSAANSFRLDWSRNGRLLLISRLTKTPAFLLWNVAEPDRVRDLSSGTTLALTYAFWAQDTDRLYGVSKGLLYEVDAETSAAIALGSAIASPVVADETLYGIVPGVPPTLSRRKLRDERFEPIAELPSTSFKPVPSADRKIAYASVSGGQLFVIDPSGDHPTAFEGRGHDGIWSDDDARLLYWSDLEVRLYDSRTGSDALITRLSAPIMQAAWHDPEWNALYSVGNALYAIETADASGRVTVPLAVFSKLGQFAVSTNGDTAFAFGTKDGATGLWKLRLR